MKKWYVSAVMTRDVVMVRDDTPYREILDTLSAHRIGAVPVVDAAGQVLGVVSESDLLHRVEFSQHGGGRRLFEGRRGRTARAKAAGAVARDLMTAPAVVVMPETPIAVAARQMEYARVTHLPVRDERGRLVGIVARGDLLRVYQRPDADIHSEVAEQILRAVMAFEQGAVRDEVHNGLVTLTGLVDRRTVAQAAARVARDVPGVIDVVDTVDYAVDDTDVPAWPAA